MGWANLHSGTLHVGGFPNWNSYANPPCLPTCPPTRYSCHHGGLVGGHQRARRLAQRVAVGGVKVGGQGAAALVAKEVGQRRKLAPAVRGS